MHFLVYILSMYEYVYCILCTGTSIGSHASVVCLCVSGVSCQRYDPIRHVGYNISYFCDTFEIKIFSYDLTKSPFPPTVAMEEKAKENTPFFTYSLLLKFNTVVK